VIDLILYLYIIKIFLYLNISGFQIANIAGIINGRQIDRLPLIKGFIPPISKIIKDPIRTPMIIANGII
jgi:hypothetical protein